MLEIDVPGWGRLELASLVMDYNGTLARDGTLLAGVPERLQTLSQDLKLHVLTADTFGKAGQALEALPCTLTVLPVEEQDLGKLRFIEELGARNAVCIGNGRNDRRMLKEAALGIAVVQDEGSATETLLAADVVCPDIASALDLLLSPLRLVATLRS